MAVVNKKEMFEELNKFEDALLRVHNKDVNPYLLSKLSMLKALAISHGWEEGMDIEEFPYRSGSVNDPESSYISEHLGIKIGSKVWSDDDITDDHYGGTNGTVFDIKNGMLVIKLDDGVIVDDQDPHGWEETS